jgi:3-oxoacyl-[acyl-carrier protein] reductase
MDHNLRGKVAIITGASSGIGRAIAMTFAGCGARVVLIARNQQRLNEVKEAIEAKGGEAFAFQVDLGQPQEIEDVFAKIRSQAGDADILVNNAGVGSLGKTVVETTAEDYQRIFDVNVRAIFLIIPQVLPAMIKAREGTIINIGSISGKAGKANQALYCASKFALVGLTESLLEEVKAHNIRVSLICPDVVHTESNGKAKSSRGNLENYIHPGDIAQAALLCVSDTQTATIKEIVVRTRRPI